MKLILGDCLEELKKLEANSVDTIITDPPAGISFMGKDWDKDKGGKDEWTDWLGRVMAECYRVAKPGSTALVWAIPRTSHWTAIALEKGGWVIKDCIYHVFGSGFPKATDISKNLDRIAGADREVVETYETHDIRNAGLMDKKGSMEVNITAPATPEAKLWNGWKSHGLKPAVECWWVAMKPNEGSYAENAMKHNVAGLWIDGARIEASDENAKRNEKASLNEPKEHTKAVWKNTGHKKRMDVFNPQGRFPANLILGCSCDEPHDNPDCACRMLDEQSENTSRFFKNIPLDSRIAYVPKPSKAERNKGCEGLEEKANAGSYQFREDGSLDGKPTAPKSNFHPTVKPIKLMEYLCTLTKTPMENGGVVLDCFAGSFTTGLACQNTGRDFIGIEMEEEYFEIGTARIKANEKLL